VEFIIQLKSAQDVHDFVSIATSRPFPVYASNNFHRVNAKNFMEMFSLDVSQPMWVSADCSEPDFWYLRQDSGRFVIG
jgi:hypothetical protein